MTNEHKEQITKWLQAAPSVRGTLLRGVRFPDQTLVNDGVKPEFPISTLGQVWRVVCDTFQVLNAQHFPPTRLSWVYERSVLHCVQRADGTLLGIFLSRKTDEIDTEGLNRLLTEFQRLALANPDLQPDSK